MSDVIQISPHQIVFAGFHITNPWYQTYREGQGETHCWHCKRPLADGVLYLCGACKEDLVAIDRQTKELRRTN